MTQARAILTLLVVLCGAALLASLAVGTLVESRPAGLAAMLLEGCAVAALAAVSWLLLVLGLALVDLASPGRGRSPAPSPWLRPQIARLAVGAVLGGGLATSPAMAAPSRPPTPTPASWAQLGGLRPLLPPAARPAVAKQTTAPPAARHAARSRVVVRPGDSLWGISEELLRRRSAAPSRRDVVAAWHLLYATNRGVVGRDPDLILPGTTLRVPRVLPSLNPHE